MKYEVTADHNQFNISQCCDIWHFCATM